MRQRRCWSGGVLPNLTRHARSQFVELAKLLVASGRDWRLLLLTGYKQSSL